MLGHPSKIQAARGWQVFEAPGVEPVFPQKRQAIDYAETRVRFRAVKFVFSIRLARSNTPLRSTRRIESCDCGAVLRLIDRQRLFAASGGSARLVR
jgi:hypothetical protein